MKNGDRSLAMKNYLLDVTLNPNRFDSWAAIALCKAADIEDKLRSFDAGSVEKIDQRKVNGAVFAFKQANKIEKNGKILIEFAQFLFSIGTRVKFSLDAQVPIDIITLPNFNILEMSLKLFEQAKEEMPEEEWLVLYMKGKIAEKRGKIQEPINYYFTALAWLDQHASYPKKIQSEFETLFFQVYFSPFRTCNQV